MAFYNRKIVQCANWKQIVISDIGQGAYDSENPSLIESRDLKKLETAMIQKFTINLNSKIVSFIQQYLQDEFVFEVNKSFEAILSGPKGLSEMLRVQEENIMAKDEFSVINSNKISIE